jgi:hypothetical protein
VIYLVLGFVVVLLIVMASKASSAATYINAVSDELIRRGAYPATVRALGNLDGVHEIIYRCRTTGVAPSECAEQIDAYAATLSQAQIDEAIRKVMK